MSKRFAIVGCFLATIALGAGCARPIQSSSYSQDLQERQSIDSQMRTTRAKRDGLSQKKQSAKLQAEIDDLQRQIDQLDVQLANMERRITEIDQKGVSATSSGGRNIGPRGGCYTITKSGKKNYSGC